MLLYHHNLLDKPGSGSFPDFPEILNTQILGHYVPVIKSQPPLFYFESKLQQIKIKHEILSLTSITGTAEQIRPWDEPQSSGLPYKPFSRTYS